ncbi:MAG: HAD family hydrolase [Gammaproteobacteria bacterium]|nr:HAD family hydrolase [Gammaproteobacteria bacterium]
MPATIKVLSFDLDDTLWPCSPTILSAEKTLYLWLSKHVPEITQRYDIQQLRDKRRVLKNSRPQLSHDLTRLRLLSFEQLANEFDLSLDWIESAFGIFYEARQEVTLFDDVKPVLDKLSKTFQLVSVTNGNANTVKTGVDHWFDLSLNSETVGKLKSEPDIYLKMQELANIEACHMAHIGDDPVNDILGAKLAGVFAIWLNRDQKQWILDDCEPDAIITSLHELPALLKAL